MKILKFNNYKFCMKEGKIVDIDPFLNTYLNKMLKEKRYLHSISVANLMFDIAKSNNLENPINYYVCGLLHDVGKYMPLEEEVKIMEKYYKEYLFLPEYAYHSYTSAFLVENQLNIGDLEILNAIINHTTGNKKMSKMSKILFAADKIDPLRGYDSSKMIQNMKKDYKKGFKEVVYETKIFLKEKHNESNKFSEDMYDYYL